MHRALSVAIVAALLLAAPAGCSASSRPYRAEATDGRVVEAFTEKPIEGVIVVAHWEVVGGFMEPIPLGDIQVLETVTDREGAFHFDAWGPVDVKARFDGKDPELILFKPGYEFKTLRNSLHPPGAGSPLYDVNGQPRCVWDKRTLELKRQAPSRAEVHRHLVDDLYALIKGRGCTWKQMPRLLKAMLSVIETAPDGGPRYRAWDLETLESERHRDCGSVEAYLQKAQ